LRINTGYVYWKSVRQIYAMALASVNRIVLSVRLPLSHSKFNKKVLSSPASPLEIFLRMDLNCRVLATVLDLRSCKPRSIARYVIHSTRVLVL